MFEESLVESTAVIAQRNRWPAVASVALQAMFAATVLSVPLIHPEPLALHAPQLELIAPAIKPPQPPPPPQRVPVVESSAPAMSAPAAPQTLGPRIPDFLHPSANAEAAPAVGTLLSMNPSNGNGLPFTMSSSNSGPNIAVARTVTKSLPIRISSGISAGLLLAPIQPAYPSIARAARVEGAVVIHAIISKEGTIVSAQVTSGPAMLQGAALDAVRTARYRPYLLNGEPTEVETTFTVNFRMNS